MGISNERPLIIYKDYTGCFIVVSHRAKPSEKYLTFMRDGKSNWSIHRWMYQKHKGQIPEGLFVCHTCDNPRCVNPDHLFLGTQKDNQRDSIKKERNAKGEKQGHSKLTEKDIMGIRKLNLIQEEIAKIYNTTQANISRIKTRQSWAWLK